MGWWISLGGILLGECDWIFNRFYPIGFKGIGVEFDWEKLEADNALNI
jgi:hypothetical protein